MFLFRNSTILFAVCIKLLKIAPAIYWCARSTCEKLEALDAKTPSQAGYRHNLAWLLNLDDDDDPTEVLGGGNQ